MTPSSERENIVTRAVKAFLAALRSPAAYQRDMERRRVIHEWEEHPKALQQSAELHDANHALSLHILALAKQEGIELATRTQAQLLSANTDQQVRIIFASGLEQLKQIRLGGDVELDKLLAMGRLEILKLEFVLLQRIREAEEMVRVDMDRLRREHDEDYRHLKRAAEYKREWLKDEEKQK